jgi:hypothetical protein
MFTTSGQQLTHDALLAKYRNYITHIIALKKLYYSTFNIDFLFLFLIQLIESNRKYLFKLFNADVIILKKKST